MYLPPSRRLLGARPLRAELFHRPAGAKVALGSDEQHLPHVRERVVEHQALDFSIHRATPMAAGEEGVADRNALSGLVVAVAGAADRQPPYGIDHDQTGSRLQGAVEERPKAFRRAAAGVRMLRPDKRVRRGGEQLVKVLSRQRPQRGVFALEGRL